MVVGMALLIGSVSASGSEDMDGLIAKFKAKHYYKGEPDERFINSLSTIVKSKDEPILIVCRRGVRSKFAAQWLAYKGYTNVYNQERGVKALIKYKKTKMVDKMY
jgi:rhodanese-related sulfurtransferase